LARKSKILAEEDKNRQPAFDIARHAGGCGPTYVGGKNGVPSLFFYFHAGNFARLRILLQ
jgi:hypothetical protein